MKWFRKASMGMAAVMALMSMGSAAALAEGLVVATDGQSNLRKGPGLGYADVGTIHQGETADYMNQSEVDSRGVTWYYVYFEGDYCWVSSKYTTLYDSDSTSSGIVTATGGQSNLRTGPGLNFADVGTMLKGETAQYLGTSEKDDRGVTWYYIRFEGGTCWVSSKYTTLTKYGSYYDGGEVVATDGQSNLREGPGLNYADVGTLHKGDTAEYMGRSEKDSRGVTWYYVFFGGDYCWVSSKYTTLYASGISTSGKVVGKSGNSNVRTGPGLDFDGLGVLHKGDTAEYLGKSSTDSRGVVWYYVYFEGDYGWVSSKYTVLNKN